LSKSIKDWYHNLGIEGSMQIAGIVMVVPAILLLLMLLVAPFGYIIFASFIEKGSQGFSFGNYAWLSSPLFLPSFRNSLIIGVGSVLLEIIIAVPLAILLNQKMYLRGLWRALITLPWAVPTIAVAAAFLWLANPHYGIFNQIGLEIGLLKQPLAFFWGSRPSTFVCDRRSRLEGVAVGIYYCLCFVAITSGGTDRGFQDRWRWEITPTAVRDFAASKNIDRSGSGSFRCL
jgi:ABC-type spermidine/putrescine transport system permease subunit I